MAEVNGRDPGPPILVTGMHRSGTTLLVNLLTSLGGFFGSRLDPNTEDYFFMRLNEWVMRRAGGAWDWPLPTLTYLRFERFFEDTRAFLAGRVESGAFASFTGGTPLAGRAWGFKDPRTVFTGALWARVFPGARLLVIRRNGVDAANSLVVRERRRWAGPRAAGDDDYLLIRPLVGRFRDAFKSMESYEDYLFSTRCLWLPDAFRLWEEYVLEAERLFESFPGPKLALRYESLIENPEDEIARAARFCGLAANDAAVREAVRGIDRARAYAFVSDPALCAFYEQVRGTDLMQRFGYGDIVRPAAGARR